MTPTDLLALDYLPPVHAGAGASFVLGVAVLGLGAGAAIAAMLLRAFALGRIQTHEQHVLEERSSWPLVEGANRVVRGRVDRDEPDPVAVEVKIRQTAKNHTSKNSRWHTWEDAGRTVRVGPFYLEREDGQSVLVEPDESVLVIDVLETENSGSASRTRSSDVRRGEQFFAYGDLHRGQHARGSAAYRDGSIGWVLRPPRGSARMLFATESIAGRYADRILALKAWGAALLVGWVLFHAVFTAPFVAGALFGSRDVTTVVGQHTYVTTSKNSKTTHYVLETRAADGFELDAEVDGATYFVVKDKVAMAVRPLVPLLRVGNRSWGATLGWTPNMHWLALGLPLIAAFVVGLIFNTTYKGKFAWYDREKLSEYGGPGHRT